MMSASLPRIVFPLEVMIVTSSISNLLPKKQNSVIVVFTRELVTINHNNRLIHNTSHQHATNNCLTIGKPDRNDTLINYRRHSSMDRVQTNQSDSDTNSDIFYTMAMSYCCIPIVKSKTNIKRRRTSCMVNQGLRKPLGAICITLFLIHSTLIPVVLSNPSRQPASVPTVRTSPIGPATINPSNDTLGNFTDFPSAFPSSTPSSSFAPSLNFTFTTIQPNTLAPTRATVVTNNSTNTTNTTNATSPSSRPIKTNSPTRRPTRQNSTQAREPTLAPSNKMQKQIVEVYLLLTNMTDRLSEEAIIDFSDAVSAHIKQSIEDTNPDVQLISVVTVLDNDRFSRRLTRGTSRRVLQVRTPAPLQTTVNVVITFNSADPTPTIVVKEWVKQSFDSSVDKNAFIDRLQQNDEFKDVVQIDTRIEGETDSPSKQPVSVDPIQEQEKSGDNNELWIIVGASAVGFVVILILILLVVRRGKRTNSEKNSFKPSEGMTSVAETSKGMGYAAEINVDRQDDISTLGDPVYGGPVGGMIMDEMEPRDEFTASIGPDYDYTRRLGASSRTDSMGTNTLNNEIGSHDQTVRASEVASFSKNGQHLGNGPYDDEEEDDDDDVSFEEQFASNTRRSNSQDRFEVEVPPGKLGMVIDTPNNGVPVVHAIKQESVLCDRVYVGDRLVSVDGEDVTSMTAVQVSKLISLKSDQRRLLVFLRAKEINGSHDDFY